MARCMLCSTEVADPNAPCPHCGGAVEDVASAGAPVSRLAGVPPDDDVTWVAPPVGDHDPTRTAGDLSAPWDAPPDPSAWGSSAPAPGGPGDPFGRPPPAGPSPGPGPTDGAWAYGPAPYGPAPYGTPYAPYGTPYAPEPASYGPAPAPYGPAYGPSPYGAYGGPPVGGDAYGVPLGGYPAPVGGYGWAPPVRTNGLAIASLITSLVGVVLAAACVVPILACPVGAVLGHVALRRIATSGEQGRGLALAGIIVGWIATGLLALVIVAIVALGASG